MFRHRHLTRWIGARVSKHLPPATVHVVYTSPDAQKPTMQENGKAVIHSLSDIIIPPGESSTISTGIAVIVPKGYRLQAEPTERVLNLGLIVPNLPMTIIPRSHDELLIMIKNPGAEAIRIQKGANIGQMWLEKRNTAKV